MSSFGAFLSAALGIVVVLLLATGACYSLIRVLAELRAKAAEENEGQATGRPGPNLLPEAGSESVPVPVAAPGPGHGAGPGRDQAPEPGVPVIFRR